MGDSLSMSLFFLKTEMFWIKINEPIETFYPYQDCETMLLNVLICPGGCGRSEKMKVGCTKHILLPDLISDFKIHYRYWNYIFSDISCNHFLRLVCPKILVVVESTSFIFFVLDPCCGKFSSNCHFSKYVACILILYFECLFVKISVSHPIFRNISSSVIFSRLFGFS